MPAKRSPMTGPLRLSAVTLSVCSAFLLLPYPNACAFVVTSSLSGISARWGNSATTSLTAVRGNRPTMASRRAHIGVARMSSSPAEVPSAAVGEEQKTTDPYKTELPDSFEDSVARMGKSTLQCLDEVCEHVLRVDRGPVPAEYIQLHLLSAVPMGVALRGDSDGTRVVPEERCVSGV